MHLSIVIPAFNEAKKIQSDLNEAFRYLEAGLGGEILVVDDGSSDETFVVARAASERLKSRKVKFRILGYPRNRGKGYAIRHGIHRAKGEYIAFVDSGLCVPYEMLSDGLDKIKAGFDFAIGSRRVSGATIEKPNVFYRRLGSLVFNKVVRVGLGVSLSDTQCGFKIYRADVARDIFSRVHTDGFMFDLEALMIAQRLNYRGTEFAVHWQADSDSRYRPFWGTMRNLTEIARIRLRHG